MHYLRRGRRAVDEGGGRTCTFAGKPSSRGVKKSPGAMVLMRMPDLASSRAIGSIMPTMAPLEAL